MPACSSARVAFNRHGVSLQPQPAVVDTLQHQALPGMNSTCSPRPRRADSNRASAKSLASVSAAAFRRERSAAPPSCGSASVPTRATSATAITASSSVKPRVFITGSSSVPSGPPLRSRC
jgi:hypothetical protein